MDCTHKCSVLRFSVSSWQRFLLCSYACWTRPQIWHLGRLIVTSTWGIRTELTVCQEWWLKLEEKKRKQTLRSWAGCPHCRGSVACSWITIEKSSSKRKANMGCHIQNQKCQQQVYTQARWVQEEMKRPEEENKGEKVCYITRHLQRGESTLTASEMPFQKYIHLKKKILSSGVCGCLTEYGSQREAFVVEA